MEVEDRNGTFARRTGRTPYRVELKFALAEWEFLCEQARQEHTSVYNVLKHRLFNGTALEDHSHHQGMTEDPRSDLEIAGERLEASWRELVSALKDSPPGRLFTRFADWLFTLGQHKAG